MTKTDVFAGHMGRTLRVRATLIASMAAGVALPATAGSLLEDYRWRHRILLAFSPSADDLRLQETLDTVSRDRCGFDERDVVIGTVLPDGGHLGNQTLTAAEGRALRSAAGIGRSAFAVVLVGKDGGEKLRVDRPPRAQELFELIDAMPMRRAEMRVREACPDGDADR